MSKKIIAYFEGTDSPWLTTLIAQGHDTIPVSNGFDNHGKNVRLYNETHKDDIVIGYLHKVIAPIDSDATTEDILHACKVYEIPVLLACPAALQDKAKSVLGEMAGCVTLVDPAEMVKTVEDKLG
jgi:hypothetical protein